MKPVKNRSRQEIDNRYKWNIEAMYPEESLWEQDFEEVGSLISLYPSFSGTLSHSGEALLAAYQKKDEIWLILERMYVYSRMKKDEDNRLEQYQNMNDRCSSLVARAASALSFFTPELLEIQPEQIHQFYEKCPGLETYRFAIDSAFREKAHILTPAEENIMAQYSEITGATNNVFSMLNNADMRFDEITDEKGEKVELTHGRFIGFMESKDQRVRKEAFQAMYAPYKAQINTLAALYNYNTKTDVVQARLRNYPSSLDAALSGDNINPEVYFNLVDTVNRNLDSLMRYVQIRKKLLGLEELHMYDVYVPLFDVPQKSVSYEEGVQLMKKGLEALGPDYLERMEQGVKQGWVDVYENEGKTSGAYSFGSYDSMPYILMNYNDKLKDVFTLAHEMGHSMHSLYTRETQPFIYGGHSIFTAEVASTVNEALMMKQMIADEKDPQVKKYLLNLYIEEFRSTVFRQTMFAEFELLTHNAVERGEALTSDYLCREYLALVRKYFGPDVVLDDEIKYEWARIPHFYNAFYVYKYATGFSAAAAISRKILEEGPAARDAYIDFLRSGESDYPIELLKIAGVDMSRPEPIDEAMKIFSGLIDELEALI